MYSWWIVDSNFRVNKIASSIYHEFNIFILMQWIQRLNLPWGWIFFRYNIFGFLFFLDMKIYIISYRYLIKGVIPKISNSTFVENESANWGVENEILFEYGKYEATLGLHLKLRKYSLIFIKKNALQSLNYSLNDQKFSPISSQKMSPGNLFGGISIFDFFYELCRTIPIVTAA